MIQLKRYEKIPFVTKIFKKLFAVEQEEEKLDCQYHLCYAYNPLKQLFRLRQAVNL